MAMLSRVAIPLLSAATAVSLHVGGAAVRQVPPSIASAPWTPIMCAPALLPEDIEAMAYRDLQAACKEHGLGARGKADELREKLNSHFVAAAASSDGSAAPASQPLHPEDPLGAEETFDDDAAADESAVVDPSHELIDETDAFDDDLFDQFLSELSDPFDGLDAAPDASEARASSPPQQAVATSDGGSGGGGGDGTSLEAALDALDALDSSAPPAAGADEAFDDKWLDDLFGPIDQAQAPRGGGRGGGGPRGRPSTRCAARAGRGGRWRTRGAGATAPTAACGAPSSSPTATPTAARSSTS